jgi:hypothetical protein
VPHLFRYQPPLRPDLVIQSHQEELFFERPHGCGEGRAQVIAPALTELPGGETGHLLRDIRPCDLGRLCFQSVENAIIVGRKEALSDLGPISLGKG